VDDAKLLRRRGDLQRSLTLLRVFLLASALICAGAGVALGSILSRSLKSEALNAEETALARYVDGVVHPLLVRNVMCTSRGSKMGASPKASSASATSPR
jgi:hypothetical protein